MTLSFASLRYHTNLLQLRDFIIFAIPVSRQHIGYRPVYQQIFCVKVDNTVCQ